MLSARAYRPPGIEESYDLEMSLIGPDGVDGFAQYWASLHRFRARMHRFLQNYDAILSPVCATPAVPHGASIEDAVFRGFSYTMTYNLTGWPAAVVRCGESASGLPINMQIAAHPWREAAPL